MKKKIICPYCEKEILFDEPKVRDVDGDYLHLYCYVEQEDGNILNSEMED